jgi:hypothetical protein
MHNNKKKKKEQEEEKVGVLVLGVAPQAQASKQRVSLLGQSRSGSSRYVLEFGN